MAETPTDATSSQSTTTILEDADLLTLRDALHEGKQVKVLPDGSLEVSPDVVDAADGPRGRGLHRVPARRREGARGQGLRDDRPPRRPGVRGQRRRPRRECRAISTPRSARDDLLTIKVVLGMGANVAVLPDGTVQTRHNLDQTPRTQQQLDDLMAQIDAKVADGSLATEARAGRGLTIADTGDGQGTQLRFAQAAPDQPGIALPDDPVLPASSPASGSAEPGGESLPEDPTGVDLADLADQIDARADATRSDALQDQVAESTRLGLGA